MSFIKLQNICDTNMNKNLKQMRQKIYISQNCNKISGRMKNKNVNKNNNCHIMSYHALFILSCHVLFLVYCFDLSCFALHSNKNIKTHKVLIVLDYPKVPNPCNKNIICVTLMLLTILLLLYSS